MFSLRLGNKTIKYVVRVISVTLIIMALLYVSDILRAWIYIPIIAYASLALGLTLTMAFLIHPMRKQESPREALPWYDILFIIVCLIGTGYVAFFIDTWTQSTMSGLSTPTEVVLFFSLAILVVEATRRAINLALALTTLVFLLYAPIFSGFSLERVTTTMYFMPSGIVGTLVTLTFTVIAMFLLFGAFLQKTNAGKFLVNSAMALVGRWTGGPGKASVISTCVMGMVSGVGPANAAVTGSISIPIMRGVGYRPEFAAGVEGVSANGSAIMPPVMGIAAFIMADFLGMTYWAVCVAAFIPAFLYYFGILVQVHLEAKKYKLLGLPPEQLPSVGKVFKTGWFYLIPLFLLIYLLAVANLPAELCGMYTAFSTIGIGLIDWQVKKESRKGSKEIIRVLIGSLADAGEMLIVPAIACAGAGIIIATISTTGIGFKLGGWLLNIAGGNQLLLLFMVAVASFILGINLPPLPCYMIMAVLIAPTLIKFGILPLAAQLFCFYWGLQAEITPPVAVVVFIAAGIAKADPLKSGLIACRVGFLSFILPFIFVYHNSLLLIGPLPKIIQDIVTAATAIIFLGAGFEGYLLKALNWLERIIFIAGGALLLWAGWRTDILGVVILAPALLWHIKSARKMALASKQPIQLYK
jgi:TRAP transporter 4TM/12TM fusion protein